MGAPSFETNQFSLIELCEFCNSNGAVLPSLEAFDMRVEIPVVYIIFYDYFLKPSVGDARWKKICMDKRSVSLGSVQSESFAMILLRNNYFAWLLEAKKALPTLVTEYCPEPRRRGKRSGAQAWMGDLEIDMMNGNVGETHLVGEDDDNYDALVKKTEQGLKRAVSKARQNDTYKEMMRTLDEIGEGTIDDIADEDDLSEEQVKLARMRKKRKILKPLREYTVRQGEEGKFKGWSRRAADDMARLNSELKEKSVECAKLQATYMDVYRSRHKAPNKKKNHEEPPVNYSELWDLEPAGIIDI